jgi:hypothetical protein
VLCDVGNRCSSVQSQDREEGQGRIGLNRASRGKTIHGMSSCGIGTDRLYQVAGAVRDLFKACQDIIRDYATRYKAFEAQDILLGQNYAVDELKRLDLLSTVSTYDPLRIQTLPSDSFTCSWKLRTFA